MPVGSVSEDVANIALFRKYMAANTEYWYRYILDVRGREPQNGDVLLVTGWDKTKAWGMATFSNTTAQQEPFSLQFRPVELGNAGLTYGWECSGCAQVRAGPGVTEKVRIRMDDPSQDGVEYRNQCLFIRTLNVNLQEKVWKRLASEFGLAEADKGPGAAFNASHSQRFSQETNSRASGSSSRTSQFPSTALSTGWHTAPSMEDIPTLIHRNSVHLKTASVSVLCPILLSLF